MELKNKIKIYRDGNDTIVVITDAPDVDSASVVSATLKSLLQADVPVIGVSDVVPSAEKDILPTIDEEAEFTPDFLKDEDEKVEEEVEEPEEPTENIGDYVVQMNSGKYRDKGLTLKQIYEQDAAWLIWMRDKYQPKTPQQHEVLEKIKQFMETVS